MKEYITTERKNDKNNKSRKKMDAGKSLNNYINQLKIHFDLDEREVISILENIARSRTNNNTAKKWWQIWK